MFRSVLALVLLFLFSASARATTVVPLSFTQLVNESAAIVYGRVADVRGQWAEGRHAIESVVTLEVMSALKGSPGETMTFSVPGGALGRFVNVIPGAPTFARGDLIVVFLTARGVRLPGPTGLSQGIYRAAPDQSTGAVLISPPVVSSVSRIVRGDPQRRPMPLTAFRDAVRAVAGPAQ